MDHKLIFILVKHIKKSGRTTRRKPGTYKQSGKFSVSKWEILNFLKTRRSNRKTLGRIQKLGQCN